MRHELAVPEVTFEHIFPTLGTMCIYFYFSQHLQYMYIFAKNFSSEKKKKKVVTKFRESTRCCILPIPIYQLYLYIMLEVFGTLNIVFIILLFTAVCFSTSLDTIILAGKLQTRSIH